MILNYNTFILKSEIINSDKHSIIHIIDYVKKKSFLSFIFTIYSKPKTNTFLFVYCLLCLYEISLHLIIFNF